MSPSPSTTPQHSGTRMRQQILFSMTGLVIVLIFMITRSIQHHRSIDRSESGFDKVNKDDEEDFEYSKLGGVNTMKLSGEQPADIFGTSAPMYDPKKSDLYIHVGPIKTGVADIENEIRIKYMKQLILDQYTILPTTTRTKGNTPSALDGFHEACQHELSLIREKYSTLPAKKLKKLKSLDNAIKELSCWKSVLDLLAPYKPTETATSIDATGTTYTSSMNDTITIKPKKNINNKQSVIIFDEQLGKQLLPNVYEIGSASLEWITVRDTIMNHFNIIVVVNYRRYYEWLPSIKGYTEQQHLIQHTASVPRLAKWPGMDRENGMLLEPLFPHFVHNAIGKIDIPYTMRLMDIYRPYVSKIEILNLHIPDQSIATTFLCDTLPSATTACSASKKSDQIMIGKFPAALSDPFSVLYNSTEDEKWYNFQLYDELVTTAAARGLVRTRRITRPLATSTTEYYVEQYLKISEPRTSGSIPLTCPNTNDIRHFLDESLTYERTILGNAESKSYIQHHKDGYDAFVKQNTYCSINMRLVLRQVTWRNFFRHLTNLSAPKILAGGKPYPTRKVMLRRW